MANEWPTVPLGEVMRQNQEYIDSLEPRIYPKLSVKLYGKGVMLDAPANGSELRMKRHQIAKSGQVILSEIWGKKGAIGFVPQEGAGALCTSHFFLFDVHTDKIEPKWLQAIFTANYLQSQLDAEAKGTTGYAAVRPKNLLAATIPLPPFSEQRRLVARIEQLAAKIEEARGLRRQAVEEAEALVSADSSRLFESLGYKAHPIGETFTFRNDLIRPIDGESGPVTFIGLQHIESHTGKRVGEDQLRAEELMGRKFRFSPNEIVYGYLRPYLNKVWVADCEGVCSVDQYVLRPKADVVSTQYLAYFMRSNVFLQQAIALTHNLLLPRLRTALLESIPIPLPPLPEQHRIVAYLDALQSKVDALKQLQAETQAELNALLPSVLDKAFKGEL